MTSSTFLLLLSFFIIGIKAQYNTPPPYDRNRSDYNQYDHQNPPYDRSNPPYDRQNPPYDRQNPPYDRQNPPYDRQNPPYDRQPPYDRNNPPPYDRNQSYNRYNQSYDRQNQTQYGPQGPPYDPYNRDRYDNRDQYYVGNRDQYDRNRDQYDKNRDQYDRNRDQYDTNRDNYDRNRDPYDRNRDQYDRNGNRDQYGGNRDQYGGNRDQYGGNRDQYGGSRDQYGNNDRNRDRDDRYGSPTWDTNSDCCQEYCYSKDEQPYLQFATKTAYQIVFTKTTSQQHRVPDCTPIQFWSINRHGTRYPSERSIQRLRQLSKIQHEIVRNYDDRNSYPNKGRLCSEDLDRLRRWRWNETVNERNANALTPQGVVDLKFLARRYASKFEELLREPYSENTYTFQYTSSDRTHDSYQAYIEGLFKEKAYQVHANLMNDRLIRPSSNCRAWQREVEENPQRMYEYVKFKHNKEYQQMVRDVFRRLGFRYTLNESVLTDMYDLCRYEKAWNLDQPSPWCAVFNKDQLKLLEYAEDLKYYQKSGYGNDLSRQLGCPPLKDLYEKLERTVNNNGAMSGNKVTVFFTHSTTIQTFLTAMGVAKDYQPLTADNYYQQQHRKWRTSKIDPFAANFAAVLYQCRSGERFRVMFFLNEEPVNFPECSVGLCNWSTVQSKLRGASDNCNLEFCDRSGGNSLERYYIIYFTSLVAIFLSFKI